MLLFVQQVTVTTPLPSGEGAVVVVAPFFLLQAARHAKRGGNGCEHGDNHIDKGFPVFTFHKTNNLIRLALIPQHNFL